jgi:tetratricopeptide (TPR) repeat protein
MRLAAVAQLILLAIFARPSFAEEVPLSAGYEAFYNNDYDAALAFFEKQAEAHPNDASEWNHVAQAILYRELFRNGALESQLVTGGNAFLRRSKVEISSANRQRFADSITRALALSEDRIRKNDRDVSALYQSGASHALRSTYSFLVEKAFMEALREAAAARRAQARVVELDRNFLDAHLTLGVYQYIVASLPFYLRAVGFVNGFHGDRTGGLEEIESVARGGTSSRYDGKILLAVLYRREREAQKALPLLEELAERFPGNYLFLFEQVQMYSDLGDKASAVRVLQKIEALRQSHAPGYAGLSREKIAYTAGNLNFWYRDYEESLTHLKVASANTEALDLNTALLTWLRLGQVYDLLNHRANAITAYREAIRTAPSSEVAAEAKRYIESPYKRQKN